MGIEKKIAIDVLSYGDIHGAVRSRIGGTWNDRVIAVTGMIFILCQERRLTAMYFPDERLFLKKRGGGFRIIAPGDWWIDDNTPVGDDATYWERKSYGGRREFFRCEIIKREKVVGPPTRSQYIQRGGCLNYTKKL